jgi:ElaB/YqjD/DUF883 family membrane-anchored ribosome-binding protein
LAGDEVTPTQYPKDVQAEFEKSRESAARLMESLAQKTGAVRAVRGAASGIGRAARYVQDRSVSDLATVMERLVRQRPAYSIAVAVVAGFVVGRALRSR